MKKILLILGIATLLTSCSIYKKYSRPEDISTDKLYGNIEKADTTTMADVSWREFFTDKHLQGYIEQGLKNNIDMLLAAKIIRKPLDGLKVLGNGELTKKLTVKAAVFSATAKEKIEAAGGKAEEV